MADTMPGQLERHFEMAEARNLAALAEGWPKARVATRGTAVAATFGGGSPLDVVKGWGLDGASVGELDALTALYAGLPGAPRWAVEISSHAHPDSIGVLTAAGYRPVAIENVLVRDLERLPTSASHVTLEPVAANDRSTWADLVAKGFGTDDRFGIFRATASVCRVAFLVVDGLRVGGTALRIDGDLALLMSTSVSPEHRRRGVHTAALAARLREAAEAGCRRAKLDVDPGSRSHRNAHRAGFRIAYVRTAFELP